MQSILISSKNKELSKEKVLEICKEFKIGKHDISFNSYEKFGIGEVREIQKKIFLKPLGENKAVILDVYDTLTHEAQNAMLKFLEESPESTIIMLVVSTKDLALPTILSRCKVFDLNKKRNTRIDAKYSKLLNEILKGGVGDRLKIAQDLGKEKDEALVTLENLALTARDDFENNYKTIKLLQETYTIIYSTNVNVRFALENLFLNL